MKCKAAAPEQEPPAITRTETLTAKIRPLGFILTAMVTGPLARGLTHGNCPRNTLGA